MQAAWPTKFSPIRSTLLRDRVFWYTFTSALTLTSRLFICLLTVILVGVTLVVAWPLILIGAMIVALSKGIDALKRPPTKPPAAGESGMLVSPLGDEAEGTPDTLAPEVVRPRPSLVDGQHYQAKALTLGGRIRALEKQQRALGGVLQGFAIRRRDRV